jgi:Protein of unknown function (DUF3833)
MVDRNESRIMNADAPWGRGVRALGSGLASLLLLACAGPTLEDHAAQQPVFDFRKYFDGPLLAHGVVSDRGGKVLRRFVVRMRGAWTGDNGTLDEEFIYDDGERQHRVWRVRALPDGRYAGSAADVVGEATGASAGPAFNWRYTLKIAVRGDEYAVQFDDWLYLVDERTVINKAVMSKFGLRVSDVILAITKP